MSLPQHLCIAGLGLIGGSLAAALKSAGYPGRISALVRREKTGEQGLSLGYIDDYSLHASELIADADMVMLAVPMLSMRAQMEQIKPFVTQDTIITDAGSVKVPFIEDARAVFGSLHNIVPGHPIAGRERSGVQAADAKLYINRRVLLTPETETRAEAISNVRQLWELTGAAVECLEPVQHDRVLAATSHLPHVMAFALVDTLATQQEAEEIFRYAAGGFRDFTRIASSDPIMWRDVCLANRSAVLEAMDNLDAHTRELRTAIERSDATALEAIFTRAKSARDQHTES